jgi:hypothetical protein
MKEYRFADNVDSTPFSVGELNWAYPVDISILGGDALWVDRFQVNRPSEHGGGRRWYGSDNTAGWCLSTQANDHHFDQYATVPQGRCSSAYSLHSDRSVRGRYYTASWIQRKAAESCTLAKRTSGRRIEVAQTLAAMATTDATGHPEEVSVVVATPVEEDAGGSGSEEDDDEGESNNDAAAELLFPDPADPNTIRASVVAELHEAIHELIRNGVDISDIELDALLDNVLLTEEHRQEAAAHDGEVAEDIEGASYDAVTEDDD